VDKRALIRLRIAFLLLAAALLLPLGLLLRSVDQRLEAQRRMRHELVADRIFDEMEGELSALLQREDARPSAAYADADTRVENWAPFVVGYYTRDTHGARIVAKPQLASERVQRLEAALRDLPQTAGLPADSAPLEAPYGVEGLGGVQRDAAEDRRAPARAKVRTTRYEEAPAPVEAKGSGAQPAAAPVQRMPEAIIKQLNRAADVREREQARPPSKRKAAASQDDPLSGMD
jgi:hypothetical protein